MIKINKGTKPKILEDNAQQWTAEYLAALKQPPPVPSHIKSRYQNSEIKDALEKETHGKCAYCESKFNPKRNDSFNGRYSEIRFRQRWRKYSLCTC